MNYGRKIKEMITDSDYKQKQIAKELNITESMLSSYLTGRHDIPVWVVVKFAELFDVSTDYLLERTDAREPQMTLTEAEQELVRNLRTLTREQKELIAQNIRFMQQQNQR